MTETNSLLAQMTAGLGAALLGAVLAVILRQPVLLGYLVAGVVVGPFTPGFVVDVQTVDELATVGVVFLMFAVGAQLPIRDLLGAGRSTLVPAALQVALTAALAFAAFRLAGFSWVEALFFGAVVSNSSSTVLGKVFSDHGQLNTAHGRGALVWSSVQDLGTVLIVPGLLLAAGHGPDGIQIEAARAILFVLVAVPLGLILLPWIFRRVAALRISEVFVLAVAAIVLALALAAAEVGISLPLGAFLAGVIVAESDLAHRILPHAGTLRDIFSALFFVSVGMLIDVRFVLAQPGLVLLALGIIVVAKGGIALALSRALTRSARSAAWMGVGLAQCGEFSFLMARIGTEAGAVTTTGFNVMLAAAALSILVAPWLTRLVGPLRRLLLRAAPAAAAAAPEAPAQPADHAVVCGYGRVGVAVCDLLEQHGCPYLVVEEDLEKVQDLAARGVPALVGDAGERSLLELAGLKTARLVVVSVPDPQAARRIVDWARQERPDLPLVVRTHDQRERRILYEKGVDEAVLGEQELALAIGRLALERFDVASESIERTVERARHREGAGS